MVKNVRRKVVILFLIIAPLLTIFFSLFIGRFPLTFGDIVRVIYGQLTGIDFHLPETFRAVVLEIRLPRAILGAMVGGSLAISGAALQGLFQNPLVDSRILGVTSGAGFGAALAIIFFNGILFTYLFSFGFGILAVILSYSIGRIYNKTPNIMLVLGGVIVSSVFSSLVSFLKYIADPTDQLPSIVFWLMGSLATANYQDIFIAGVPILLGVTGLLLVRWRINVLSMGDREAQALGIHASFNKALVIICATLATSGAVCVSGTIGWVGLIIPHIGRMIVGNDNRVLIPASMALGATFLIWIDNISRVLTGSEIPLSIITSLVGGPFYVYLLKKTRGGGW